MNTYRIQLSRPTWALLMLAAALGSTPALAAGNARVADAQAIYRGERVLCMKIESRDERSDCLRQASITFANNRSAPVEDDPGRFTRNALARCGQLPEPDRKDCMARMQGQGTTAGSVAGGGIYRELVTRETAAPNAPQPTASAASAPPAK